MRTPNILRDQIYRIVTDQSTDPAAKALALQNIGTSSAADIAAPSPVMPMSTMSMAPAPGAPAAGAFSRALGATPPPTAAFPDVAAPSPAPAATAAFPNVTAPPSASFPDTAPPGLGDEIDRRRALTVAALGTPTATDYSAVKPPPDFQVR